MRQHAHRDRQRGVGATRLCAAEDPGSATQICIGDEVSEIAFRTGGNPLDGQRDDIAASDQGDDVFGAQPEGCLHQATL
jgi:hypothetical protein